MTPVNYHNIQVLHTIAPLYIVGSKFIFLYLFETGLRMLLEGGQIQPDILNEISIVLITIFSLNNCDNRGNQITR